MRNPIIVALDVSTLEKAVALVEELSTVVGAFKVGSELFSFTGPEMIRRIRQAGASVFLDLKLHDIPQTVARAVAAATHLGVQMMTVHTSGGAAMLEAAQNAAAETARALNQPVPLVLGVTVLTSLESSDLSEIGFQSNVARQVERLAQLAVRSGLRGLVCSPLEVAGLRQMLPEEIQLVTPGIRAAEDVPDDQKRTLTAAEALAAGANWLVVGRPVYASANPRAAAERILESLKGR